MEGGGGKHILVEVDVQHDFVFSAADHKRLVKSLEVLVI